MQELIIYNYSLQGKGGVTTFTHNLCKRLSKHYSVTLMFSKASNDVLLKIGKYCNVKQYNGLIKSENVILASAWGINPNIKSKNVIQVIHSDFKEQKKHFRFVYHKNKATTKHVAVGDHVKEVFESMYDYKIDKVIYNLLDA